MNKNKKNIMILILCLVLFVGCSTNKDEPVVEECNPEIIYEYETYMGLLVNGKDRSHLSTKSKLKEGIDSSIIGAWERDEEDDRYVIIIFYEDGSFVVMVTSSSRNITIFNGVYSTEENYLIMGTYAEGLYEISDKNGVEIFVIHYEDNVHSTYKRLK